MHHFSDRSWGIPVQDWKSFWSPSRLMALTSPLRNNASAVDHILRPRNGDNAPLFSAGDKVRVRSAAEILSTLDMSGRLDGTPFVNSMMPLIGAVGVVARVVSSAEVVLEFASDTSSEWKAEWLVADGPAPQLSQRGEDAARKCLAALAADYHGK